MPFDDIQELELSLKEDTIKIRLMELENGLLVLLTDNDRFRMGHSAAAVPPSSYRPQPTSTGLFSTGPASTYVRTLAERISHITNQMAVVVAGVKDMDQSTVLAILQFLKQYLVQ